MGQGQGIGRWLGAIGNDIGRGKSRTNVIQDYDFVVAPTCPPTTALYIRAGKAWPNSNFHGVYEFNVEKPADTVDFAATTNVGYYDVPQPGVPLDLSFASAGYYKAVVLCLNYWWIASEQYDDEDFDGGDDWKYYVLGGITEYATATDSEAAIDAVLAGGAGEVPGFAATDPETKVFAWCYFPLRAIVLRNDGTTGVPGAVQPIDLLNRGRSYLYRDVRPGKNWMLG